MRFLGRFLKCAISGHISHQCKLAIPNAAGNAHAVDIQLRYIHALTVRYGWSLVSLDSGNWRLTFCLHGEDAEIVDYQDYHKKVCITLLNSKMASHYIKLKTAVEQAYLLSAKAIERLSKSLYARLMHVVIACFSLNL